MDPDLLDRLRVGPLVSMARHTHQYTIGDDEAVKVLLDKLLSGGSHQQRREKLLKALGEASRTRS